MKKQNSMRNIEMSPSLNMPVSSLTSSTLFHGFGHVNWPRELYHGPGASTYSLYICPHVKMMAVRRNRRTMVEKHVDSSQTKNLSLTRGDSRNDDITSVAIAVGKCIYSTRPKVIRNYRLFPLEISLRPNHAHIECQICFNQLSIWKTWTRCNSETGFIRGADRANL